MTPYLLSRISSLTDEKSLRLNERLILNNAEIGSQIAKDYCQLISNNNDYLMNEIDDCSQHHHHYPHYLVPHNQNDYRDLRNQRSNHSMLDTYIKNMNENHSIRTKSASSRPINKSSTNGNELLHRKFSTQSKPVGYRTDNN